MKQLFLILTIFLLLTGCGGGSDEPTAEPQPTVAPTVALLPTVRKGMSGKRPEALDGGELCHALRNDIAPIDDVRSTRAYRLHVAERLILRMIERFEG